MWVNEITLVPVLFVRKSDVNSGSIWTRNGVALENKKRVKDELLTEVKTVPAIFKNVHCWGSCLLVWSCTLGFLN